MQPKDTNRAILVGNHHRALGGIVPGQGSKANDFAAPESGRIGEELGSGTLGINSDDAAFESGDQKLHVRFFVLQGEGGESGERDEQTEASTD